MNTRKIVAIFTLVIAISLGVCIMARAEEPSVTPEENIENAGTTTQSGETHADFDKTGEENNFFASIYEGFMEHSGEILGALTFIGSLILAYAYRRGLLPLVKSALTAMAELIGSIKTATEENGEQNKALGTNLENRLDKTENTLFALAAGVEKLTEELCENKLDRDEREKMKLIISSQIDMLYEIFMTSSLPEFQKEALSEKITKMREALE